MHNRNCQKTELPKISACLSKETISPSVKHSGQCYVFHLSEKTLIKIHSRHQQRLEKNVKAFEPSLTSLSILVLRHAWLGKKLITSHHSMRDVLLQLST